MKKTLLKITSILLVAAMLFGVGIIAFAQDDAAPFRISCVINGDASTQRGITWYTKTETDSLIEINCDDAIIEYEKVFEWDGNYCHQALISNLTPGTEYEYTVGSKAVRSEAGKFVTDNGDDEANFIVVGDIQASNEENFQKGLDTIEAGFKTMPNAEFLVNLGDFTNDSDNTEWDLYDGVFADFNRTTTLVPITGNHDGFGRDYWFKNMFFVDTYESVEVKDGVNYSFDYGNAHIAVLNTNDIICMSLAQMNWLKNDMNSTDKDWKIVFMHKSPYTLGKDGKWPDALYLSKSVTKVFDACDVDLVMSGHDHQYLRTKPLKNNKPTDDGTVYVLAGTAGSKRYEVREFLAGMYMKTDNIANLVIQKDGYGNYWDGETWENTDEKNVGGCFNTVSIKGGNLTLSTYILSDTLVDENGERLITKVDEYTINKQTGQNKITYTGENKISEAEYALNVVPSFFALAVYAFGEWLPKFFINLPALLKSVIVDDVF